MTEGFIQLGHTVLGCGQAEAKLAALRQAFGTPNKFSSVNVTSDEDVQLWAKNCLSSHGPPDLLINNAGVINPNARLWEVAAKEFARVMDVNVNGTANVIRHFVPEMVRRQTGVIVNFSSGWGRSTDAKVAPYCASKWAIEGLTLALAQELPAGMAAIPLNPGIINTEMLRESFGPSASSYPSPETWAKTAVPFLLRLGPANNGKQLEVML
jgi:NAD(P)-dependent dehydrogenase (short-subunit alcohol dehydrogenase family)